MGEATARELTSAGAVVTITDRDVERGSAIAADIGGVFVASDVTDEDQVAAAVSASADLGAIAGGGQLLEHRPGPTDLEPADGSPHRLADYKLVIEINQIGTFNLLRLGAAAMAQTEPLEHGERGLVVNTASVAAYEGQVGQIAYAASKAAVVGMTITAARDLSNVGIRVNAIAPGLMQTPMLAGLQVEEEVLAASVVFPKRLGRPDEYARLVRFMAENGYLNGETIRLDGALRMPPR